MVERKKIIEEFDILERATFGPESYIIKAIKMLVLSNERLEIAIKDSNEQSQKLEQSNYKLQWAMLILTALATAVVIYPTVKILMTSPHG